jgi:twitching motility protein PilT
MTTVHELLKCLADTEGASDLVITAGVSPQLRIFREMIPINCPELSALDAENLCMSLLDEEQTEQLRTEKEYDTAITIEGVGRFRVNLFQQQGCYSLVARIIMEFIPDFDKLRIPLVIQSFAKLKSGLVLFTGPTGSGKTTTLAALVDHINNHRPCNIITIEDPIEVIHKPVLATINQREVGTDTASYNQALRRVLRQAPDVIMIGEIRDLESAQAAISLAETGHLTLATLHTRGAVSAVNRLVDLFPPNQTQQVRSQLASALSAVVWQQLLPSIDNRGLVLACEVMIVTPAVRALILNGNTHEIISMLQTGKKYGMCTMDQAVEDLVAAGTISSESTGHDIVELLTH